MPATGVNSSFNRCQNIAGMARSYNEVGYALKNKGASSYVLVIDNMP
jgi:hypothetical protein